MKKWQINKKRARSHLWEEPRLADFVWSELQPNEINQNHSSYSLIRKLAFLLACCSNTPYIKNNKNEQ